MTSPTALASVSMTDSGSMDTDIVYQGHWEGSFTALTVVVLSHAISRVAKLLCLNIYEKALVKK